MRVVRADRQSVPDQHPPRLSRRRASSRRWTTTTCATTSSPPSARSRSARPPTARPISARSSARSTNWRSSTTRPTTSTTRAWPGSRASRTSTTACCRRTAGCRCRSTSPPRRKHDNGAIFVQTVSDYPLVEAIHQNVVKHPMLPDAASRAQAARAQERHLQRDATPTILQLGVEEWRKSYAEHEALGKKAVLFVMVDDTRNCDEVGAYLEKICPELQRRGARHPHQERTAKSPKRPPARARRNWKCCARQSNEIDSWAQPLQGHRLRADAQGRLGRAQRHHHRRPARLYLQEQHPARADARPRLAPHVLRQRHARSTCR